MQQIFAAVSAKKKQPPKSGVIFQQAPNNPPTMENISAQQKDFKRHKEGTAESENPQFVPNPERIF